MALQRQITLRNVKGTALTYAEMDKNLSSFFYSASLDGADLNLHYTGSSVLGSPYTPTSVTVPLNPLLATITQLQVAGNNVGDIQYRINNTTLGANTTFKWDTDYYRLGVGTPSPEATIHVVGQTEPTTVRLSATPANKQANIDFTSPIGLLGSFGKTRTNSSNIFIDLPGGITNGSNLITTVAGTNVTQTSSTGLGIFTGTSGPNRALTVVGVIGVGATIATQGQIGSIGNKVTIGSLPTGTPATILGLLIESPYNTVGSTTGGHVVIGINKTGTATNDCFSVIAAGTTPGTYDTPILTAKVDNKVGINNRNPAQALDIVGNTTMTGTATIGNVADSQGANSKVLTVNGSGLVQYSNNLMPKGGIIMWGGSLTALPTGWKLCDGNNNTPVNGVTIPDLRERFIVGAGGNNTDIVTFDYNTFIINKQLTFTIGPSTSGTATVNGTFTKIDDNAAVSSGAFRSNASRFEGNPYLNSQYALYELIGATFNTSYYIVYNFDVGRYRMYRGFVPADNTVISSTTSHNYFEFPDGALAQLKQVGNNVIFRPNYVDLSWQQSGIGYAVGDKGGFNDVQLKTSEMPSHYHHTPNSVFKSFVAGGGDLGGNVSSGTGPDSSGNNELAIQDLGSNYNAGGAALENTIGGDFPHENRPPYYALAFIIYTGV